MKSLSVMRAVRWWSRKSFPSPSGGAPYRAALTAALLIVAAAAPATARIKAPPQQIILDAADPVIAVELGGQPFRLRVELGQWDVIELNPAAAARLPLAWSAGRHISVGRVTLWGRNAETRLVIEDVKRQVLVAEHGRIAAEGADGVIGPDLLPHATILWRNVAAPADTGTIVLPLRLDERTGISAPAPALGPDMMLRFSPEADVSSGTAAAGAILAQRFDGHFAGASRPLPVLFGVTRPARPIAFGRVPVIAGFRFPDLLVRTADFRGDNALPAEDMEADIVVARVERPQGAQPWVTIGRDRLSRCAEIAYSAAPRSLTLRCAFDPG
ncbi:hypothetical protein HL653_06600 [Sphingomonas sp. AP4-R1]|uniref:hypothetical protein n=1 Tax=Sphingomonas sp. AP4-R1 TaxID=2735134 RepID=UPI0014932F2A|nr:hypothetical protein [Sphingomonas sp. AP4-R1]QJU57504.1 hypothetical protein HL653_06600 [Sphingomonas sp. AP4-R1]